MRKQAPCLFNVEDTEQKNSETNHYKHDSSRFHHERIKSWRNRDDSPSEMSHMSQKHTLHWRRNTHFVMQKLREIANQSSPNSRCYNTVTLWHFVMFNEVTISIVHSECIYGINTESKLLVEAFQKHFFGGVFGCFSWRRIVIFVSLGHFWIWLCLEHRSGPRRSRARGESKQSGRESNNIFWPTSHQVESHLDKKVHFFARTLKKSQKFSLIRRTCRNFHWSRILQFKVQIMI